MNLGSFPRVPSPLTCGDLDVDLVVCLLNVVREGPAAEELGIVHRVLLATGLLGGAGIPLVKDKGTAVLGDA